MKAALQKAYIRPFVQNYFFNFKKVSSGKGRYLFEVKL